MSYVAAGVSTTAVATRRTLRSRNWTYGLGAAAGDPRNAGDSSWHRRSRRVTRFVSSPPILTNAMKTLVLVLTLSAAGFATGQHAPISADEVTLRHRIYGDGRVTIFLLDIPPGQATVLHRHDRDMLSVFVNGGRTRASFNGAAPVEDSFTPGDVRFQSAGFTHSTENLGADRFLSVIFEFVDSQGPRAHRPLGPPRASAIRGVRPPASRRSRSSARAGSVSTT